MAHTKTYIDPGLPLSVARVAKVTGNPMLDTGYQCRGERPYFKFTSGSSTYFTTLHPSRCTVATEVSVYTVLMTIDVATGDRRYSVIRRGTGSQLGAELTYDGTVYTNSGGEHTDVPLSGINKWAKCKPIRYDKVKDLTDAERRGSLADRNAGYYYGVHIAAPAGSYAQIHDADFEYRRPRGSEHGEPYRLSDFSGYDADAAPGLSGTVADDALYKDLDEDVAAFIDVVRSGTTGIDFAAAIVAAMGAASTEDAFADLYPMVLIDGWAAAMTNSELGRVTPLYSGGVWYRGFGFDLKALDDAVTGGLTLGSHRLSLFLVPDDPLLDLSGAWQDVESTVGSRQAFAVPGAAGLDVEVKEMYPLAPQVRFVAYATNTTLSVQVGWDGELTQDMEVRVTVRVTGGTGAATKTVTMLKDAAIRVPAIFNWLEDLGLRVVPGMQQQISVTVTGASWYVDGHETSAQSLRTTVTVGN